MTLDDVRAGSSVIDRPLRDRSGRPLDLQPLAVVLDRIIAAWDPEQIWLFGSRARGDAVSTSDWDVFVVGPDHLDEEAFEPLVAWRLREQAGVPAHITLCRASEFREDRGTPNTIAYEVAANALLLYER